MSVNKYLKEFSAEIKKTHTHTKKKKKKKKKKENNNKSWKVSFHYENTPIQIYRKFHLQKLKIFR